MHIARQPVEVSSAPRHIEASPQTQRGFVMVAVLALIVPLVLMVGAFSSTMLGRNAQLQGELDHEAALLAAESGVDYAVYLGRVGSMVHGLSHTEDLGFGQSFSIEAEYLGSNGLDDDGDTATDEADEDAFRVEVIGRYRGASRRVATFLGPVSLLPPLDAAIVVHDPNVRLELDGTPLVSGLDTNRTGGTAAGPDVTGIAIAPPGNTIHLTNELSPTEATSVLGIGGTLPSVGTAVPLDVPTLVGRLRNAAATALVSGACQDRVLGLGRPGIADITFRDGDLSIDGTCSGSGVLVVTGNLTLNGTFDFDGVLVVLGEIVQTAGAANIYGAILHGPLGGRISFGGAANVQFSTAAIASANSSSGRYVSFNGWQESSR